MMIGIHESVLIVEARLNMRGGKSRNVALCAGMTYLRTLKLR